MEQLQGVMCLDEDDVKKDCAGEVQFRRALSSTGVSFSRCDKHWAERVEIQEGIDARYPAHAPADFDPMYAGERWDKED